jgi:hypothetical protein
MEKIMDWNGVKEYLEAVFNPNPPNPANKFREPVLLFMMNILEEQSFFYKEAVETHLSDLQDNNADQVEIEYFKRLHEQWMGIESSLRNKDSIVKDLQLNIREAKNGT